MNDHFYAALAGFDRFEDVSRPELYVDAPSDWFAVVTDIRGSTRAIEEGRYKDVNLTGAAVITSVLNATGARNLPYAFGGDGATLLIPPHLYEQTMEGLAAVITHVAEGLELQLRAGIVALSDLYAQGAWLRVSKFNLSPNMAQAVFQGTALSMAERWLKQDDARARIPPIAKGPADLGGLKCRWKPIDSTQGQMVSLLVRAADHHAQNPWMIYGDILKKIADIYPDAQAAHPAHLPSLGVSFSKKDIRHEADLRGRGNPFKRAFWMLWLFTINLTARTLMFSKLSPNAKGGQRYLNEMSAQSDARKFDEMLRMVLDSTGDQVKALRVMLEEYKSRGDITYGMHSSPQALMTCLVFSLEGNHVHFIDGADGGYALAAKMMKEQAKI